MAVSTLFPQDQNALGVKKLNEVELERKEISTKFDEANQTIGALRFENNFLAEKTKKLEAELFQVRARLERTSIAKVDEMFSLQKSAFNRIGYVNARNCVKTQELVQTPN